MQMPSPRATDELFRDATSARDHTSAIDGVLSARGYGFALANQIETSLLDAYGSSRIASLAGLDVSLAAGRMITSTRGFVRLSTHIDELFDLVLVVVSPTGGHDAMRFRWGSAGAGLARGKRLPAAIAVETTAADREAAQQVADAWMEAMQSIEPADFAVTVESDFGRVRLGIERGVPSSGAGERPHHSPPWDPAWLADADRNAGLVHQIDVDAAMALRDLHVARLLAVSAGADAKPLERQYVRAATGLWPRVLPWLEAELAAVPEDAFALPPLVDHLAQIVPFPPTVRIADALGGQQRPLELFTRAQAVRARRWAAHPW